MDKFHCYSMRLSRALQDAGFKPISVTFNKRGQMYYIFDKTDELMHFKDNVYQTVRDNY